jgi:hypothetical protein
LQRIPFLLLLLPVLVHGGALAERVGRGGVEALADGEGVVGGD